MYRRKVTYIPLSSLLLRGERSFLYPLASVVYRCFSINYTDNATAHNYLPINNQMERIIELYEQKVALYERMLQSEKEKVAFLEDLLSDKWK